MCIAAIASVVVFVGCSENEIPARGGETESDGAMSSAGPLDAGMVPPAEDDGGAEAEGLHGSPSVDATAPPLLDSGGRNDSRSESGAISDASGGSPDGLPSDAQLETSAAADTGSAVDSAGQSSTPSDSGANAGPEMCASRAPVDSSWKLKWADEFDTPGAPNPANWGFEQGFVRNQELQWYQPNNATVANGLLTIAARRQQVSNPNYRAGSSDWTTSRQYAQYTSSSLTSSGKRSFEYGRFEMCGQIDVRQGSWPAFWILGNGKSWPSSGEVDIMEYYVNEVRANVCKPSGSQCDWTGSVAQPLSSLGGTSWGSSFHLWAMEWDSSSINLYLDDKLVYGYTIASANPYTGNPFYIIVNLAIGANGGDPSNTAFPITYAVDYVRVYQH